VKNGARLAFHFTVFFQQTLARLGIPLEKGSASGFFSWAEVETVPAFLESASGGKETLDVYCKHGDVGLNQKFSHVEKCCLGFLILRFIGRFFDLIEISSHNHITFIGFHDPSINCTLSSRNYISRQKLRCNKFLRLNKFFLILLIEISSHNDVTFIGFFDPSIDCTSSSRNFISGQNLRCNKFFLHIFY
jgi:hypothetical protein